MRGGERGSRRGGVTFRGRAGPSVEEQGRAAPLQGVSAGLGRCGIEGGGRRELRAVWSVLNQASLRERTYPRDGGWGEKFRACGPAQNLFFF